MLISVDRHAWKDKHRRIGTFFSFFYRNNNKVHSDEEFLSVLGKIARG